MSSGVSTSSGTVSGISASGIAAKMTAYTSDLQDNLIANHSDKSLKQITGGWEIQRTEAAPRVTSLSGYTSSATWGNDVPTAFRATLSLATTGFSQSWDLASIYAYRMQGQLAEGGFRTTIRKCDHLDTGAGGYWDETGGCFAGTAASGIASGQPTYSGDGMMLSMTLNHPYAAANGAFGDETTLKELEVGKRVDVIVRTAGGSGSRRPYQAAAVDPLVGLRFVPAGNPVECDFPPPNTQPSEENCDGTQALDWTYQNDGGYGAFPLGESPVGEMGSKKDALINIWSDMFDRTTAMVQALSGARIFHQHSLGIAITPGNGLNALDINTNVGIAPAGSDHPHYIMAALAALASAEEGAAVQQSWVEHPQGSLPNPTVHNAGRRLADGSTLKLLTTTGSTSGLPSGVNADTRVEIEKYLADGYSVVVNTTANDNAFLARSSDGSEQAWIVRRMGHSVNPAVVSQASFRKGASDGTPNPLDYLGKAEARRISANVAGTHMGAVDLRSGTLSFSEGEEITVGQGAFPYSLSFSRSYSSTGPVEGRGDLGMGWSHNWMSSANTTSDVGALFPDAEAITGAPTIVGILIALEAGRADTIQASLISGVALNWWQDQAAANVVALSGGGHSARFVRLADGTWRNPSSPTEELEPVDGEVGPYEYEFDWTLADRSVMSFRLIAFNADMPFYDDTRSWGNSRNALQSWTFPSGVVINLTYSGQDLSNTPYLTSVSNNLGATLTFTHQTNSSPNASSACFSAAGTLSLGGGRRSAEQECYELTRHGGLLTQVSAGNDEINFGYNYQCPRNTNFCAFILNNADRPGLRKRQYVYGVPDGALTNYTDHQHLLTEVIDEGVTTPRARFVWKGKGAEIAPYVAESYDAQNRKTTYYSTNLTYSSAKDALNGVVRQTYDEDGRLAASSDAMGRTARATYDGPGRSKSVQSPYGDTTSFQYDGRGNLTQRTQTPVAGCSTGLTTWEASWWCQTIVIKAEYHATWNKPTKVILPATSADPNEREWTMSYNSQGLLYQTTGPQVWDAKNGVNAQPVWTNWYDGYGRITKTKDPTGIEATQTWGGAGLPAFCLRQSQMSAQTGGIAGMTTTFACDAVGNVTSVTDPLNRTTTTTYDDLRRKVSQTGPSGTNIQTQWVHDLNGDMTQEKRWDHAASAWRTTTITYSATHKPLTVTDPAGDMARTCYDDLDRPTKVIDPMLRATITDYNASGQPTAIRRWHIADTNSCTTTFVAPPGSGQTEDRWRRFGYNAAGMQTQETDARGNVTTVTYDGLGRPITTVYADTSSTWTLMDQRGQVVVRKQRGGTWAALYYDAMGRDYHVQEFNNGSTGFAGRNSRAAYDLAGRPVWRDVSTQTTTGLSWDDDLLRDVRNYAYDAAGRLVTEQVKPEGIGSGAITLSLAYGYDLPGNRTSITWPGSWTASYTFDAVNRPTGVSFPGGGGTQSVTTSFDSLGRRTAVNRPGSAADSAYAYETDSDLASLSHAFVAGTTPGSTTFTYGHDASAKVTSIAIDQPAFEWMPTLAYDRTYGTPTNLNQTTSEDSVGVTWNTDANMAGDGVNSYTWTFGNRLIGAYRTGMTASYTYDSDNRRTKKVVNGVTTRTLWSGSDELAELDSSGTTLRRFVPDGSGAMDARLATVESDGTVYWHHTDHQGSVIATSKADGTIEAIATYSPYGEFASGTTAPPTHSPFGYTGRQYDPETGLYQYRARYYSPRLGVFLSTDPVGTKDDPNLYMYVGLDPVNATDPSGECKEVNGGLVGICGQTRSEQEFIDAQIADPHSSFASEEAAAREANWLVGVVFVEGNDSFDGGQWRRGSNPDLPPGVEVSTILIDLTDLGLTKDNNGDVVDTGGPHMGFGGTLDGNRVRDYRPGIADVLEHEISHERDDRVAGRPSRQPAGNRGENRAVAFENGWRERSGSPFRRGRYDDWRYVNQ